MGYYTARKFKSSPAVDERGGIVNFLKSQIASAEKNVFGAVESGGKGLQVLGEGMTTPYYEDLGTTRQYTAEGRDFIYGPGKRPDLSSALTTTSPAKNLGDKTTVLDKARHGLGTIFTAAGIGLEEGGKGMQDKIEAHGWIDPFYTKSIKKEDGSYDWGYMARPDVLFHKSTDMAGQMFPALASSIVAGNPLPMMLEMGLIETGAAYDDFEQSFMETRGLKENEIQQKDRVEFGGYAILYGIGSGLLETLPFQKFINQSGGLAPAKKTLRQAVLGIPKEMALQAMEEGGTEGVQQLLQNALAKESGVDPGRLFTQGVGESVYEGAAGSLLFGLGRGVSAMDAVPQTQTAQDQSFKGTEKQYKESGVEMVKDGKLDQKIVDGRVNDMTQKMEMMKLDKKKIAEYTKHMGSKNFESFADITNHSQEMITNLFGKKTFNALMETVGETEGKKEEVSPEATGTPLQATPAQTALKKSAEPAQEFKTVLSALPQEVAGVVASGVSRPMNKETVSQLTTEERQLMGVALNVAKQLPGQDLKAINNNIKLIEDSGVEIPTKSLAEQEAKETVVEKEVETPVKQKAPKEVKIKEQKPKKQKTQEAYVTSDLATSPNIPASRVKAEKTSDGKYKLVYTGTTSEVFEGEKFETAAEARSFFKVQKEKAQQATKEKPAKKPVTKPKKAVKPKKKKVVKKQPVKKEVVKKTKKVEQKKKAKKKPEVGFQRKQTVKEHYKPSLGRNVESYNRKPAFDMTGTKDPGISQKQVTRAKAAKEAREIAKRLKITNLELLFIDRILTGKGKEEAIAAMNGNEMALTYMVREFTAQHELMHALLRNLDQFKGLKKQGITLEGITKELEEKYGVKGIKQQDEKLAQLVEVYFGEKLASQGAALDKHTANMLAKYEQPTGMIKKFFNAIFDWAKGKFFARDKKTNKSQVETMLEFLYEGEGVENVQLKKAKKQPAKYITDISSVMDYGKIDDVAYQKKAEELLTDKGALRTHKVFAAAWRKLYGENPPVMLKDILKNPLDEHEIREGFNVSFLEGKKLERENARKQKQQMREKNAKEIRKMKIALRKKFRAKKTELEELKKDSVDYINANLPLKQRGKYLNTVAKIKTEGNLAKLVDRVDKHRQQYERKLLRKSIENLTKHIDKLPVDFQRSIIEITSNLDLKKRTKKLLDRLNKTKIYLDTQANDFGMPLRVLNELGILEKTPIEELTTEQLIMINNRLQNYQHVGRNIMKQRRANQAKQKSDALAQLEKTSKNIDVIDPKIKKHPEKSKNIPGGKRFKERLSRLQLSLIGMDRVFNRLDGRQDYKGANYKIFKERIDEQWDIWQNAYDKLKSAAYLMANDLQMTEENSQRIAIYAYNKQRGGREKLMKDHGMTAKEIDAIKLTKEEMAVYKWMRKQLDDMHDALSVKLKDENNEVLGKVENYFPMMTDYSVTKPLVQEIVAESRFKSVPFGSLKERRAGASQPLKLDAFGVFESYMQKGTYFMAMDKAVTELSNIASSERYRKAVGENAQKVVLTWLDVLARMGGPVKFENAFEKGLNKYNNRLTAMILGFRITTIAKQPLALLDGAAEIGHYAFAGTKLVLDEKWRNFMDANSSELRNRTGGDPMFEELTTQTKEAKKQVAKKAGQAQEYAMLPIKFTDRYTAGAVWAGAYTKKMDEMGEKVDLRSPNKEAIKYADLVVRKTQASGNFKDLPSAMVNEYRTASKLFFKFQNFMMNRWSYLSEDLPDKMKNNPRLAIQQLSFIAMAMAAENAISQLWFNMIHGDDDDDDTPASVKFILGMLASTAQSIPFLSHAVSATKYGANPVPLIATADKAIDSAASIVKAKKGETKAKHTLRLSSYTLGTLMGLPTDQARQLIERVLFPPK